MFSGPEAAKRGERVTIAAAVSNLGVRPVGAFTVGIFLLLDNEIAADRDRLLGTMELASTSSLGRRMTCWRPSS
jgi:hypothetical protein